MERIKSFTIDHNVLTPGFYISREDGNVITYDLRTRKPNNGDYMSNEAMHSVEHMFATYIRSSAIGDSVIYFGPMGCQTGFYLLVRGRENEDTYAAIVDTLNKIVNHTGEMFGQSRKECGNYKNLDIEAARTECRRYLMALGDGMPDFKYRSKDND